MKRWMAHGSSVSAILVALTILGCGDFAPIASPAKDAGPVTSTTALTCDGTKPNPECSAGARNGAICTMDCCYPAGLSDSCGLSHLGYRTCTCPNGFYEWCNCLPPPSWPPLPAGGDCSPNGNDTTTGIGNAACTKEWTTCFSTNNHTCICLKDATTGKLNLRCVSQGSSNGTWVLRVPGIKTEY